jgi:NAD(P)-dependent dehydrogenase (short-subunit alcohol dehydrogenase family)
MASMLLVLATLLMAVSFLSPPAQAADGACQAVSDVGRKVLTTPTHIYSTRTAAFRSGGKPTTSESIYAGVIAFTKALSREVCDTGIRVNCVAPGPIDTDLIRRLGPDVVEGMISASPLKRLGSVDEVAGLILWLCSPASSFNTGAVFDMSGGRVRY